MSNSSKYVRLVSPTKEEGMLPLRKLLKRYIELSSVNKPSSKGHGPVRKLLFRPKKISFFNDPKHDGMDPDISDSYKNRYLKLVSKPIEDGIVPVKCSFPIDKTERERSLPSSVGTVP